ncbi:MAG: AAA-like domain-containing protein [Candidatus Omnitrophota bacterium]
MKEKQDDQDNTTFRKPKRIFENSGAVNPAEAYFIFLDHVTDTKNQDIQTLIDTGRYFSIFAPRQSGKTTFFKRLCDRLHQDRTYIGIVLSFQQYEGLEKSEFYAKIEEELYEQLTNRLTAVGCDKCDTVTQFLEHFHLTDHLSFGELFTQLNRILQFKKIVIFIDEFDGIPRSELGNFLASLRDLYQKYKEVKQKALYSIALVGIRNITKLVVGGVSPFNIADQVQLPPFSLNNIRDLYSQYTTETNQPFTEAAVKRIHAETEGQPWLVNRLATILTVNIKPETVEPIDEPDVDRAIQILIKERNSHFDNLDEKAKQFKETFIEIVFDGVEYNPGKDDQTWLEQFGLIRNRDGKAVVANNIYKMRYLKMFFDEVTEHAYVSPQFYELPGGLLDMKSILLDFDRYIAQIGVRAFYENKKPYEKTGQFFLTAWLYQFARGGWGDLRYESITGLGRMDILLNYKNRKYIIETKVNHRGDMGRLIEQGILQITQKYLITETANEGFLVIFDAGTAAGATVEPTVHTREGKSVTCFVMGIGYQE